MKNGKWKMENVLFLPPEGCTTKLNLVGADVCALLNPNFAKNRGASSTAIQASEPTATRIRVRAQLLREAAHGQEYRRNCNCVPHRGGRVDHAGRNDHLSHRSSGYRAQERDRAVVGNAARSKSSVGFYCRREWHSNSKAEHFREWRGLRASRRKS